MKSLKSKVSLTLDQDLLDLLKKKAEEDDRSLSQYINRALHEYLKIKSSSFIMLNGTKDPLARKDK